MKLKLIILLNIIIITIGKIKLYHLTLSSNTDTFTLPFHQPYYNYPSFSYFIQQGTIDSIQFSLCHNTSTTTITKHQITISFLINKSFNMRNSQSLSIALIVSDQPSNHFQIGVQFVNVTPSITLSFQNMILIQNGKKRASLKLYSLAFPIIYSQSYNEAINSTIILNVSKYPTSFNQMAFSYLYYSIEYIGYTVFATYSQINHNHYTYRVLYNTFAFRPTDDNTLFAMRTYDSSTSPFYNAKKYSQNTYLDVSSQISMFLIGYNFANGPPSQLNVDLIVFNNTYISCANKFFLHSLIMFETLPLACTPCHQNCLTCSSNQTQFPEQTDNNSCSSCNYLRYLNKTQGNSGSCLCWKGLSEIDGTCLQCSQKCLLFQIQFIEFTQQSNFLLRFSEIGIRQLIPIQYNLKIDIENTIIQYQLQFIQESVYSVKISPQNMKFCRIKQCKVHFKFVYPEKIESQDALRTLNNMNQTISMKNYIDIKNYLPSQLALVFQVLGLSIGATYTGGYSSLIKVLLQSQQLINIHRYLNLQLPIIFNQLVNEMQSFRFLDLTNFLPNYINKGLSNVATNKLDHKGPSKLIYYDNGVNFYKNSISGMLSCLVMIIINLTIYFILSKVPTQMTKTLAKKIKIRRLITIHDILEQLQLPLMHYALAQIQISLLKAQIIWLYGMALITSLAILLFPFMVIIYIYLNRKVSSKRQIFEDLMQDNSMDHSVTYIYYVFNYYRKIWFALFLLSDIPGLIQIYMLILINITHFSFQIYLIVTKVYLSLAKVIIRFINALFVIFLEILIVLYNSNDYDVDSMIKIGLICIYISLTATILGLIDFIIKVIDTFLQQIKKKQKQNEAKALQLQINEQLIKVINCNIGNELQTRDKTYDKKEMKFIQDKQLMQQTFQSIESNIYNIQEQTNKKDRTIYHGQNDLVYIDEDWMDVYPVSSSQLPMLPQNNSKHQIKQTYQYDIMPQKYQNSLEKGPIKQKQSINRISKNQNTKNQSKQGVKQISHSRDIKKITQQLNKLSQQINRTSQQQLNTNSKLKLHEQQSNMNPTSLSRRNNQLRIKRSQKYNPTALKISKIQQSYQEQNNVQDIISNDEVSKRSNNDESRKIQKRNI